METTTTTVAYTSSTYATSVTPSSSAMHTHTLSHNRVRARAHTVGGNDILTLIKKDNRTWPAPGPAPPRNYAPAGVDIV